MQLKCINGGRPTFKLIEVTTRRDCSTAMDRAYSRLKDKTDPFALSFKRLYRAMHKTNKGNTPTGLDLMANINYWKKHGTLPKCNMAKVMGQNDSGRYDTRRGY